MEPVITISAIIEIASALEELVLKLQK